MATHVSLLAICECLLLFTANAAPPSEEHLAMASSEYREDLATDTAEETVGETDSVNEELINSCKLQAVLTILLHIMMMSSYMQCLQMLPAILKVI